ncbi:hypothetical protein PROFUN_05424 [Planoprotostelium fungivorum]|uniref:Lysosomal dipeptide transporter MFSD1 n=1 Tax=Planoprotostelium fungivorum TaxID=1890364 RepID=A0A2P6NQP2_9EUKA|nr:hypothetical protein PROFUN_05424 [Planoprotostelium fungivorum]
MGEEDSPLIHPSHGSYHELPHKESIFSPRRALFRWFVLLIVSLICFGSYFAFDEIQPFDSQIQKTLNIERADFSNLYAIYSFPNIILVFFGGLLGDKIGVRLAALIFVLFVFAGAVMAPLAVSLTAAGKISQRSGYIFLLAGRFVFGLGGESLNVIQTSMTAIWFAGTKDLALALGFTLSMSRLGDYLALSFSPQIAKLFGGDWIAALWFGTVLAGISVGAVLLYSVLDKASERYFPDRKIDPEENALNFKAILQFDARFWIVSLLCMTYYSGVTPFIALCNDFLKDSYHFDDEKAAFYSGIIILASMILSPILGKFLDMVGNRPYFVVLGSCMILPAHLMLAFTQVTPLVPIILIGLSFSMVPGCLWPSIPLLCKAKETATAYGLMTAIQNAGLSLTNFAAGRIADLSYKEAMIFFVCMDLLGFAFGFMLIYVDDYKGRTLCLRSGATKEDLVEDDDK